MMTSTTGDTNLRLFLDSADAEAWKRWVPLGFFHGITTNPLLLERTGQPCTTKHLSILAGIAADLGVKEIHLQTWGADKDAFVDTGLALADLATSALDVVVKVPATETGFEAARELGARGCRITLTAVYQPGQVLLAAACRAAYAAPYLGRLSDAGRDGPAVVLTMHEILKRSRSSTRLLTASLRSAEQVIDLAVRGLDTFTFNEQVAEALLTSEMTDEATAEFRRASAP